MAKDKDTKGKGSKSGGHKADAGAHAEAMKPAGPPRLQVAFRDEVGPKLGEKFGLKNPMQRPRLEKIVVNVNMGRHLEGAKIPAHIKDTVLGTIQTITEDTGTEISPGAMWDTFVAEYLPEDAAVQLVSHESTTGEDGSRVTAQLMVDGAHRTVVGEGNGPIAAFVAGLQTDLGVELDVVDYSEHAVGSGSDAVAVAYVETQRPDGTVRWGVGRHESITTASFRAVVSAVNRHRRDSHTVERHEP